MNTGCPRTLVHETALQLLQVLDKRFFGTVGPLPAEGDAGKSAISVAYTWVCHVHVLTVFRFVNASLTCRLALANYQK